MLKSTVKIWIKICNIMSDMYLVSSDYMVAVTCMLFFHTPLNFNKDICQFYLICNMTCQKLQKLCCIFCACVIFKDYMFERKSTNDIYIFHLSWNCPLMLVFLCLRPLLLNHPIMDTDVDLQHSRATACSLLFCATSTATLITWPKIQCSEMRINVDFTVWLWRSKQFSLTAGVTTDQKIRWKPRQKGSSSIFRLQTFFSWSSKKISAVG